eukprot:6759790-Pyramimonas_sp.AAC.1
MGKPHTYSLPEAVHSRLALGTRGEPADPKSKEEDYQHEADEYEDDEMVEEVGPADAAPAGRASDDSIVADA